MVSIYLMNFNTLDLNLLRVLDALLRDHSTTRAGARIGLSQPAVSAALNRLRQHLGDPLFVREGQKLVPTPFALSLEQPLSDALYAIEKSLTARGKFDPAKCANRFKIFGSDYFSEMLMPQLADEVFSAAPNVRLALLQHDESQIATYLADGRYDFALLPPEDFPEWMESELVFHSSFVAVAATGHQRIQRAHITPGEPIPLDLFCDIPQIMFSPQGNQSGMEDVPLAKMGRSRRLVMTVPNFSAVGRIVAQSQLIAILPTRFAQSLANRLGLNIFAIPHELALARLKLYWHRRNSNDPAYTWLRQCIIKHLDRLDEVKYPITPAEAARSAYASNPS